MNEQLKAGQVINDSYRIISCIGAGGAGVVYKALQVDLQRTVALKILHSWLGSDEESMARFQREGRILCRLQHQNIVSCYSAGLWQGRIPFLVFEYLEGESLRTVLQKEGTLDLPSSLKLGIQLCDGLAYAHTNPVVHRDLKPENIFLWQRSPELSIKILDFGLAHVLEKEHKLTQPGHLLGTVAYMSPEQCSGLPPDTRSDIYAAACVLYECVTGLPPHEADTSIGLLRKHINEYPKRIAEICGGTPRALDIILFKGMAKNPSERYQSASEFKGDLSELKTALENNMELTINHLRVSPEILQASSRSTNKQSRGRKAPVLALFITGILALFFFALSDPGPSSAIGAAAGLIEKSAQAAFLEKSADLLSKYLRWKGAFLLYGQALNVVDISNAGSRIRLLAKTATSAYQSGNNAAAERFATQYFSELSVSNKEIIDSQSLAGVINIAEHLPLQWPGNNYGGLWEVESTSAFQKNYPLKYNVRFGRLMAESTGNDRRKQRLETFFNAIFEAEFANDCPGIQRILAWSQSHLDKFGNFRRLTEEVVNRLQAALANQVPGQCNPKLMQTTVAVCSSAQLSGSPERVNMLQVAACSLSSFQLDRREAFSVIDLLPLAERRDNSEAAVVVRLLLAEAAAIDNKIENSYLLLSEAAHILSGLEDHNLESLHPYETFKNWCFRIMHTCLWILPEGKSNRLLLIKELERCETEAPRFLEYKVRRLELRRWLFQEYMAEHKYDKAEQCVKADIAAETQSTVEYYCHLSRLLDFYLNQHRFPEAKAALVSADELIRNIHASPAVHYPVMDAWAHYYLSMSDLQQARAYGLKAVQGARLAGIKLEDRQQFLKAIDRMTESAQKRKLRGPYSGSSGDR